MTSKETTQLEVVKKKSIFLDEDEESDDDEVEIDIKPMQKINRVKPIIGDRPFLDYIFADANKYTFKSWSECFPDGKVSLRSLVFNNSWNEFFDMVETKPYFKNMEKILSDFMVKSKNSIVPDAELVFNSFNVLSPKQISVVIIGQDPYHGINKIGNKLIPQAMGFSFSVPLNYPKPPSLANIYENLLTFDHIKKIPEGGCLGMWVLQGCFMDNAALTTFHTKANAHQKIWEQFTNDWLEYINEKCENIVFVTWGVFSHKLCLNIDPNRHHIITTSHPSPYSVDSTLNGYSYGKVKNFSERKQVTYPSFRSTDIFGRVNSYLKSVGKKEILWDVI